MANNEITNPIPARLKNVTGGHVAGAIDIIDDTLGKEQSAINQERINDIEQLREDTQEDIQRIKDKVDDIGDAIQFDEDGDLVTVDGDDFSDPASSAKIPTIGAIKAGADTLGIVYDVSAKNPTAGPNNDGKFTLEYILDQNNVNTLIPTAVRKGGMSIKFVQSSDNKYVQYRLMADEFTTDTTQWVIAEEGVYEENPEFIKVYTDKEGKILWAIKTDGSIYYGAGVPQQVKDYIQSKISDLSLDEYEDIVAFLADYLGSDTTLKVMIDGINAAKVDKIEGKSLIDAEYADGVSQIENPEFAEVKLDSENKILWAIKSDGTIYWGAGIPQQVIDYIEEKIAELSLNEIVDFLTDYLGSDTTLKELIDGINERIPALVENPEWLGVTTDSEDKILGGRKRDGTVVENMPQENPASVTSYIDNPEWMNVKMDKEGNILNGILKDGTSVIPKIKSNTIDLINATLEKNNLFFNELDNTISYGCKDTTKNYITVSQDGLGDFTNIEDACNSITDSTQYNQYEIIVYPGTYYGLDILVPPFTHIHALLPNTVTFTTEHMEGQSTHPFFEFGYHSKLSNVTLRSHTGYCMHCGPGSSVHNIQADGIYVEFNNVHFIKKVTGNTPTAKWCIFGIGGRTKGQIYNFRNCILEGEGGFASASGHTTNNGGHTGNTFLIFNGCSFIKCGIAYHNAQGTGLYNLIVEGCTFDKTVKSLWNENPSTLRNDSDNKLYPAQNVYWAYLGSNNKNLCLAIPKSISTIRLKADYPITISGNAVPIIFGTNYTKNDTHTTRIQCWLMSEYWIKDEQTFSGTDIYQLWKRLGDCSSENKVLEVTVNGVTKAYTFNENYLTLKTDENTIITSMQSVLDNVTIENYQTSATDYDMSIFKSSDYEYINLVDEDILEFEFITTTGHKATSEDELYDIVGIAGKNCTQGEIVSVWTQNFLVNLSDGLYGLDNNGQLSSAASTKIGRVINGVFNPFYK